MWLTHRGRTFKFNILYIITHWVFYYIEFTKNTKTLIRLYYRRLELEFSNNKNFPLNKNVLDIRDDLRLTQMFGFLFWYYLRLPLPLEMKVSSDRFAALLSCLVNTSMIKTVCPHRPHLIISVFKICLLQTVCIVYFRNTIQILMILEEKLLCKSFHKPKKNISIIRKVTTIV